MTDNAAQQTTNTITQVVCELRFPMLPGLVSNVPRSFMKPILKEYPRETQVMELSFDIAGDRVERVSRPTRKFFSSDGAWSCWLKNHAIGLETTRYTSFEDFIARLEHLLEAAQGVLDTDFFTRVGLRYINALPPSSFEEVLQDRWLSDTIAAPLNSSPLNGIEETWSHTKGRCDGFSYTFRNGFASVAELGKRYVIDADFFVEVVPWADVVPRLERFRGPKNTLFQWVIGPRTREHCGFSIAKEA